MNLKIKTALFVILCASSISSAFTQGVYYPKNTRIQAEIGTFLSSNNRMPFWLRTNQSGIVPKETPIGTFRVRVRTDYAKPLTNAKPIKEKKFDWGYGLEIIANAGQANQIFLPEAYIKAHYGFLEFYAGRRRTVIGLVDTTLTSGSYAWSGNALPLPVIQIGTEGFVPISFTKGVLALQAFYNHGWFDNQTKRVKNSFLHQKALYVRIGKPTWRVKLYAGMNHQVQWGGHSDYLSNAVSRNGYLPSSLQNYFLMVIGYRAANRIDTTLSAFEENRIGNHLGSIDIGTQLDIGSFNLLVYRQSLYDDGSLFFLNNIADGLNGIRLQNKTKSRSFFSIREVLAEFLYTKSQGGSTFVLEIGKEKLRGKDDYFNHSQFIDGWTYNNRVIGSPFLTPGKDVKPGLPNGVIANNRISMLYGGISGTLSNQVEWLARVSYSWNFGTYNNPYITPTNQLSSSISVMALVNLPAVRSLQIQASIALDQGQLYNNAIGFYIGIKKTINTLPANAASIASPTGSNLFWTQ